MTEKNLKSKSIMKKIAILGVLLSALALSGCKDFLDINQNPNFPETAEVEQLLPAALLHSSVALGNNMMLVGGFWAQHFVHSSTTNQYNSERSFDMQASNDQFSRVWSRYYSFSIPAYLEIRDKAEELGANYLNYKAMAEIMMAYDLHILNSLFDKVAIDEGFRGNEAPTFQDGKVVYDKILAQLEAVLAYDMDALKTAAKLSDPGNSDYLFFRLGGEDGIVSWMKFANTLYLKLLMRDFETNRAKITAVLADTAGIGFLDAASGDAAVAVFEDVSGKSNPLYEMDRRMLNTNQNLRACDRIVTPMVDAGDPRVEDLFDVLAKDHDDNPETPDSLYYAGGTYGVNAGNTAASRITLAATDPVYFSTVAEACFLQAEAYARLGDAAGAKTNYDLGVAAAFARFGHDATSFTATGGDYEFIATTEDERIAKIMFQKWLASIHSLPWDAWMDQLRTGYPERGLPVGEGWSDYSGVLNVGSWPARYLYPQRSSDFNPNTPPVVPLTEKMWWHKQ